MRHRNRLYEKLLIIWNKQEDENKHSESVALSSKYLKKARSNRINDFIKLKYIRSYLKQETSSYAKNYRNYKESLTKYNNRGSFFWTESPIETLIKLKPSPFNAIQVFTKPVVNNLIKQAQEDEESTKKLKAK